MADPGAVGRFLKRTSTPSGSFLLLVGLGVPVAAVVLWLAGFARWGWVEKVGMVVWIASRYVNAFAKRALAEDVECCRASLAAPKSSECSTTQAPPTARRFLS